MKNFFNPKTPDGRLKLMLLVWWIINILQAAFTELADDEAYYWLFAQDLAWGYYDHPPMTALLAWLGNFIGGELGVRFFFTLLQPIYLYIIWTLIRPAKPTTGEASLFFVVSAAMPILQLYGFLAVPDGPLMLFTALFLLCFKRFSEKDSWLNMLLLALTMAGLAYSKYQGALVVIFALAANPRLFRSPKLYLSGLLTLVLFAPHLWWQYEHDWVSFRYHLVGRNSDFRWSNLSEYLLNLFAVFNPLFFFLYFTGWKKSHPDRSIVVRRAMYYIVVGFVVFFALSSVRGRTQPQWLIPITSGLIMVLFEYARKSDKVRKYVMTTGWITIGLVLLVRLVLIFNPLDIRFEVFNNKASYGRMAEIAGDRTLIFGGRYPAAAKYMFYTGKPAYSMASINYRTSQWLYIDTDTRAAGHPVVVQTWESTAHDSVKLANGDTFHWMVIEDFRPVRNVSVEISDGEIPPQVTHGDTLAFTLKLSNPYPYDIRISPTNIRLTMIWGHKKEVFTEFVQTDADFTIPAGGEVSWDATFTVPSSLAANRDYRVAYTLLYTGVEYWFNSPEYTTYINAN